nr:putative reverse transcriptase domain, ribonuclease H-like domain, aspartic peptidase domain protein [Tanacetum cinerariifolium]
MRLDMSTTNHPHTDGQMRFDKKGKLASMYVGPFEINKRVGPVGYRLRLPQEFSSVHDTFHVSNVKKCLADANLHVPLEEIRLDKTLRFIEEPVEIMDREVKRKALVDNVVTTHTIAPKMVKIDVEPIAPRLLNNRTTHTYYLRLTQEQVAILKEVVEQGKSQNPLNNSLDSA